MSNGRNQVSNVSKNFRLRLSDVGQADYGRAWNIRMELFKSIEPTQIWDDSHCLTFDVLTFDHNLADFSSLSLYIYPCAANLLPRFRTANRVISRIIRVQKRDRRLSLLPKTPPRTPVFISRLISINFADSRVNLTNVISIILAGTFRIFNPISLAFCDPPPHLSTAPMVFVTP